MIKIGVASGKGGAGKTSFSVNFFHWLNKCKSQTTQLLDCDVEEPNSNLYFDFQSVGQEKVLQRFPQIDEEICVFCGKCHDVCEFGAILMMKDLDFIQLNTDLCKSCGACVHFCGFNAITEESVEIGEINHFEKHQIRLSEGRLKPGKIQAVDIIHQLQNSIEASNDFAIIDAPPGSSCPVIHSLRNMDIIVLIGEPGRFGQHDLQTVYDAIQEFNIPILFIQNKVVDKNRSEVEFIDGRRFPISGQIPFSMELAEAGSQAKLTYQQSSEMQQVFESVWSSIQEMKKEKAFGYEAV